MEQLLFFSPSLLAFVIIPPPPPPPPAPPSPPPPPQPPPLFLASRADAAIELGRSILAEGREGEREKMSSFGGTQQKCKGCSKTVYLMDQLNVDGVVYHKACFKCNHCKGTLTLSTYSSMEGVLYCKPHFEQLFKETGSFNKNFQSPAKPSEKTPELTRVPSKAASMFSGTQEKCATCGKTAYPLEKVTVEGLSYHKTCFRCSHGGCSVTPSNYAALDGVLYCKPHFSQLFKEKGSYNHVLKSATIKRTAEAAASDS